VVDGQVEDAERTAFLESHVAACQRAVASGAPVAGYFAWSLLDNFEWSYGYAKRFGLVHCGLSDAGAHHQAQRAAGTPEIIPPPLEGGRRRSPPILVT
jgi:beta-glucosidase/6-phospho-beta-glucosidase/beta-galactosidase